MSAVTLLEHLRTHAIRTDGPFTLRSGAVVDWYLDARQTTFDGAGARAVGSSVLAALAPEVEAVGGLTMGADPIAIATAMAAAEAGRPLVAFSIRKAPKDHGTGGRLAGPVGAGTRVCLLEDTSTTGGAFFEAHDAAAEAGLEIVQAICLVDRSDGRVAEGMAERAVPYTALFTPADLGVG
jgi:orotate phosphoribosyltransferase